MHAATLAWVYTGDPDLRKKLDYTAAELVKCQLEDGYLGTYLDKDRWTEWDVWAHKYNLLGLITYMRYTGNTEPLPACRRMGDLLCRTFGTKPGQRDIITAGHHAGMAPTSVLEPMVWLYRFTGETRYLEFCQYILSAWEHPNGPHIISTLTSVKRVDKVGNGKAYEMLSCLNGALEYYRTVGGDRRILDACLNAWQDIVDKRLYITGTASYGEHFHDDFDLPNVSNVGETCVTVTWLQFNAQLLRLTGEARFAGQLERVVLNQLFGAQRPDGKGWGYYVQMEGKKPYSENLDGHCCLSSGPRGVALIPTFATSVDKEGPVVNLYESGTVKLALHNGAAVQLTTQTRFPADGKVRLAVAPSTSPSTFTLKLRLPDWCEHASVKLNGQDFNSTAQPGGYVVLARAWNKEDVLELDFPMTTRVIQGDHKNAGKVAFQYGPLVLAADDSLLGDPGRSVFSVAMPDDAVAAMSISPEPAKAVYATWPGAQLFPVKVMARKSSAAVKAGSLMDIRLIPFADAGGTGSACRIWLPRSSTQPDNLLSDGNESRSRAGNLDGSINDDNFTTVVVTFDAQKAEQDWYAVTVAEPITVARVVYGHGRNFHDGGWFDASAGKPVIQAQTTKDGAWETLGELKEYPATTATDAKNLREGQKFELKLSEPVKVFGLRVCGKPASGDFANQAFSSCSELQAFAPGK
jgi:DUF1680 family protein